MAKMKKSREAEEEAGEATATMMIKFTKKDLANKVVEAVEKITEKMKIPSTNTTRK
jgi:hypothetical protein